MNKNDVAIIGAGVIGCSIAYRLVQEGVQVTVIDKGPPGGEATHAAAGMLAPHAEAAHTSAKPLLDLFERSHSLYPDFIAELEEASQMNTGFHRSASLVVAEDYQEAKVLAGALERQLRAGVDVQALDAGQLLERESELAPTIQGGLLYPDEHFIDSRRLNTALRIAAEKRGARFMTDTPVTGFNLNRARLESVRTLEGTIESSTYVLTAGAWSGMIDKRLQLPVRPIRGQIVCLQVEVQFLRHLIHSSGCYLVPRPDGRTLIGSTVENVGFNKDVTADGVQKLLAAAVKVVPCLKSAKIRDMWAGLRPDTSDNLPILGRSTISNLIIATGHFRNGILLAPITAKLIAELILSGRPSISLEPFSADRFRQQ